MFKKINSYFLTCLIFLSLVMAGCDNPNSQITGAKTEENLTSSNNEIVQTINNNSSCTVTQSRNWQAWIDNVGDGELRLNISGEVDMPTPNYQVEWKPGILDRRQPPAQRISFSPIPPEGVAIQVITPTKVNYTMPTTINEYRSVMIYCGDTLLTEIPNVTLEDKTTSSSIEITRFTTDELFDAGGGGCGMSLDKKAQTNQRGFLFFNGIEDTQGDTDAFMSFDGKLTKLIRKSSQGEEFYGQKTNQVFTTEDDRILVEVDVTLGAKGEIESVNIPNGTITVIIEDKTQQFDVVGDAGC